MAPMILIRCLAQEERSSQGQRADAGHFFESLRSFKKWEAWSPAPMELFKAAQLGQHGESEGTCGIAPESARELEDLCVRNLFFALFWSATEGALCFLLERGVAKKES